MTIQSKKVNSSSNRCRENKMGQGEHFLLVKVSACKKFPFAGSTTMMYSSQPQKAFVTSRLRYQSRTQSSRPQGPELSPAAAAARSGHGSCPPPSYLQWMPVSLTVNMLSRWKCKLALSALLFFIQEAIRLPCLFLSFLVPRSPPLP